MKFKVIALAALMGISGMAAQANELPDGPHIVTSGTASVDAVPDIATLAIEVNVAAKDAATAKKQADERVAQYISFLELNQIAKKDISSANLRTQPDYDYQDGKSILKGYRAVRTVEVTLRQLDKLNSLLDELILSMIKALPKQLRVQFVPAPDAARAIRDWIDEHYPDLPGSGSQQKPNLPPVDEDGTTVGWPDLAHVFTKAAIATKGAQIHPEVLGPELVERLSPYLRVTFSVEQQLPAGKHPRGRRHARGPIKVLGVSKDLKALQRKFAAQAEASARQMVKKQADQAGEQGKLVSQANLLHKAGATTESRATMLWRGALDALRLPAERISSRWLGTEALMLASAPYKSTKDLVEDLQLATVKRLMPNVDRLSDDEALANAVLDVREVYEDTVYQVAHDVIAVLKAYAEVDKATGGKADLPMLSVLQSIRDHIATLVYPGFIGRTPPDALKSLSRYLRADLSRLNKAKTDKNRDVKWAWQADEARQVVDKALARAKAEPAGPKHEALMKQAEQARWMLEEFYVSLWAQELGTKGPASLNRIKKALA